MSSTTPRYPGAATVAWNFRPAAVVTEYRPLVADVVDTPPMVTLAPATGALVAASCTTPEKVTVVAATAAWRAGETGRAATVRARTAARASRPATAAAAPRVVRQP